MRDADREPLVKSLMEIDIRLTTVFQRVCNTPERVGAYATLFRRVSEAVNEGLGRARELAETIQPLAQHIKTMQTAMTDLQRLLAVLLAERGGEAKVSKADLMSVGTEDRLEFQWSEDGAELACRLTKAPPPEPGQEIKSMESVTTA